MSSTDEIKQRINVVDLIGETVALKKAGANFRGLCPFHSEKTPSFMVSQAKQIWHCFGCGLGGDIFEFVKESEGVQFPEALEILAQRAGVKIERPTAAYRQEQDQKKVLYEINKWAALFYQKVLSDAKSAQAARDYIQKRGFKPETLRTWQIGFAPDDFHAFENFIVGKGYQRREVAAAGLLSEKDGQFFDRFRGRLMFPLHDIHGRVVGFTARILDASGLEQSREAAKYINSPETLIYHKSQLIYGLHLSKNEIRKTGEAIVVEGNVDVITAHEFGFQNIVGSSGTALTDSQLEILKRFTENISFAFDVDEAGLAATRRAVELALSQGFNVRIISIPSELAKDPDELIRRDKALWQERVRSAKNFLDFYFDRIFAKLNLESNVEKKQAVSEILPLLLLLPDPIDRAHYVKNLADGLRLDERILLDLLNRYLREKKERGTTAQPEAAKPSRKKSHQEILERRTLGFLLKFASNVRDDWQTFQNEDFISPLHQEIFEKIQRLVASEQFGKDVFVNSDPKLKQEIELLIFAIENELSMSPDWSLEDARREFIARFRTERTKRRMKELSQRIKTAESSGQTETVRHLSAEFDNLSKELSRYHA